MAAFRNVPSSRCLNEDAFKQTRMANKKRMYQVKPNQKGVELNQ
jgi:hypothetical protein